MVNEFPDLQGIMGGYYAGHDGESPVICQAIREHYLPTHSGGDLPSDTIGSCVALADKLDTLTGLFAIGQPPSGSRDPFALRRQAIGVIRICIENQLSLDLNECLEASINLHQHGDSSTAVLEYILERLANWYADKGIDHDIFNAVRHSRVGISNLLEADQRIQSMQAFRQHQQAPNLIAANKRVSNILKKTGIETAAEPDPSLFQEDAEHKLAAEIMNIKQAFEKNQLGYEEKFLRLAQLQPHVDQYFDDVMVMADDKGLRDNRLSTLAELRMIFLEVADFSRLQS
jgi:glycyl-tRNA synthetase beta chain